MRHYFLFQPSPNAAAIDLQAVEQRAGFGPATPLNVLSSLPALEDQAALAERFPDSEQDKVKRYWQTQSAHFEPLVMSLYTHLFVNEVTAGNFYVLPNAWNGMPANALCFKMYSQSLGLLVVFDHLSLNAAGQVLQDGEALQTDATPQVTPAATPVLGDTGSDIQSSIFSILNYIGSGLAADGFPIVGTFVQALFSTIASWLDPNSNEADEILKEINQFLEQYKIQLETDLASARIQTWQNWESLYFTQADLNLLSGPNPDKSPDYTAALGRANNFINNVYQAFTTPSNLFDAVNLVKGDDKDINTADYNQPTDSMYKFTAFLYFSSFVLSVGKQAWMYSIVVNGKDSKTTYNLANAVLGYSGIYTAYVQKMSGLIQDQISKRISYFYVWQNTGQAVWMLTDNYNGSWKDYGFNESGNFNYCGSKECQEEEQKAYAALAQLSNDFTDYFYKKIDSAGKADLQQLIQCYIDNDAKLKNLSTISPAPPQGAA